MTTNRVLAIAAGALGALALFGGDTPAPGAPGAIGALEVARELRADPEAVVILDIRDEAEYRSFHLPRAVLAPADPGALVASLAADEAGASPSDRAGRGSARGRSSRTALVVVAGGPDAEPRAAWLALRRAGYARARYLPDATAAWVDAIVSPVLPADADARTRAAWEEQAELSRYFGGFPRVGTAADTTGDDAAERLDRALRRGCAF